MILKHKNCKVIERRDLYKMVDNAEKSYNEVHSSLTIKPLINMSVGNSDITAPINDDICKRGWHKRDRGTDTVGLRGQVPICLSTETHIPQGAAAAGVSICFCSHSSFLHTPASSFPFPPTLSVLSSLSHSFILLI